MSEYIDPITDLPYGICPGCRLPDVAHPESVLFPICPPCIGETGAPAREALNAATFEAWRSDLLRISQQLIARYVDGIGRA